jgi:DNA helicase HerA-like ATPase
MHNEMLKGRLDFPRQLTPLPFINETTRSAMTNPLPIAKAGDHLLELLPALANRHGLITGATGTGKTVTLQRMAEQLSRAGVPVFLADAKGDLSGLGMAGNASEKLQSRLQKMGISDWTPGAYPVTFWDVFGELGHPVRATISDMGPLLLARLLGLNDTQSGVLQLVFKIADDQGLLLLDLKDLRAMVQHVGENAAQFKTEYGNVSAASIGAIQRGLLTIEEQGGDKFFGEPMLNIDDLMQTVDGKGVVNVLAAEKLMNNPRLYGCFLLWLLAELFEQLPEAGDLPKPKLAFFFDEAHLLFNEAPPALLEKVEQVVRLIRSKGVGVYFVTQNPLDIPDTVLGQLGNRVQHALRAFTPRDQKAVKAAAETLRANPTFSAETAITELGVGEALVSFLDEHGRPTIVERAFILPPSSRIGPMTADERRGALSNSLVAGVYEQVLDRESAYERLKGVRGQANPQVGAGSTAIPTGMPPASAQTAPQAEGSGWSDALFGRTGPRGGQYDGLVQTVGKSVARQVGSQIGREIVRGLLGSIMGGRRR